MIEITIIQYLGRLLENVPVLAERPEEPDPTYVLIERVGSDVRNHISYATIAIQSYGPTLLAAAELNERVETAMAEITDLTDISRCELNSSYNYTDTETKEYRYQAVFDLTYMKGA